MSLDPAAWQVVLAFADDEHMIGARHAAWIGMGPFLEEDLAFCSIAQDELGHALKLYDLVVDDPAEMNRFALLRDTGDYRSCWLAEAECATWNHALVRHWLYDRAEALRWEALAGSSVPELAALVAGVQREEQFHLSHAETYMSRMSADTDGRQQLLAALDNLLPLALGIWEPVEAEPQAIEDGVLTCSSGDMAAQWSQGVQEDLALWGLDVSWPLGGPDQQARTHRSPEFGAFLLGLQEVISLDPLAVW